MENLINKSLLSFSRVLCPMMEIFRITYKYDPSIKSGNECLSDSPVDLENAVLNQLPNHNTSLGMMNKKLN